MTVQNPCPSPCCNVPRFVIIFDLSPRQFAGCVLLTAVMAVPLSVLLRIVTG